ncbi:MAG: hypothetical protein CMJ26_06185 [Phycisphaerae bacterium]|nr:hypothetical protein [Phycisphaerae bacterium]|tara:strand:- start:10617 stop:11315 length:699 start_codon:yes stop_codon:yes gene_type:complete
MRTLFPKDFFMMNFATTSLMPLLARIVIGVAMLTSGWVNCFGQIEIRPAIAQGLREMEIVVHTPAATEDNTSEGTQEDSTEAGAATEEHAKSAPIAKNETTRGVNRIVWLVHEQWPTLGGWGKFLAWSAAVAQLVAGIVLLVGLFTRLAALAIVVATAMAVYIVAGTMHGMFLMNPFDWPLDSHQFLQLFAGVGLCTLSLGLVFSGAGGFSIDAMHAKNATVKNNPTKKGNE